MEQPRFCLSVVLRHEKYAWAAQCLEYDISAQGKTIAEAKAALEKAIVGQIVLDIAHKVEPLSKVPPAPREYWEAFQQGERLADKKSFYVPPQYMVRAATEDVRISA